MTFIAHPKSDLEIINETAGNEASTQPEGVEVSSTSDPEDHRQFREGVSLQEDLKWFLANIQEISQELDEQWVAVREKQIIAHGDTVKAVRDEMQRLEIKRAVLTRSGLSSWDLVR